MFITPSMMPKSKAIKTTKEASPLTGQRFVIDVKRLGGRGFKTATLWLYSAEGLIRYPLAQEYERKVNTGKPDEIVISGRIKLEQMMYDISPEWQDPIKQWQVRDFDHGNFSVPDTASGGARNLVVRRVNESDNIYPVEHWDKKLGVYVQFFDSADDAESWLHANYPTLLSM